MPAPSLMRSYLEKFRSLRVGWNKRRLTEDDFHRLCRRFRITVVEMPLRTNGFYYCVKRRHFIAIDSKLPSRRKLIVMFHELAHYLMHAPDTGTTASFHGIGKRTRKELEADAFALCAVLPAGDLVSTSPAQLIDEGFDEETVRARYMIWERHGI